MEEYVMQAGKVTKMIIIGLLLSFLVSEDYSTKQIVINLNTNNVNNNSN